MKKKELLIISLVGIFIYLGLKKTGALYFFYIPSSDFQAETVVEKVFISTMYDSSVFTDRKEAIVFSYFDTLEGPRGPTIKLNLKTNIQEKVNYQDYVWSYESAWWGENHYEEAFSDDGEYKFQTWAVYNWLNIDSSWGYQTIEIYTKNEELVKRYNSKKPLRTIRWGKDNVLYFIEEGATGKEGIIKKILVQK